MRTRSTHTPGVGSVVDSRRTWMVAVSGALALVGVLFVLLATGGNTGSTSSRHAAAVSSTSGGPNETLRGQAVAAAHGARTGVPLIGGPNETARGASVANATRSNPNPGGPNETARGAAVHSAATR